MSCLSVLTCKDILMIIGSLKIETWVSFINWNKPMMAGKLGYTMLTCHKFPDDHKCFKDLRSYGTKINGKNVLFWFLMREKAFKDSCVYKI